MTWQEYRSQLPDEIQAKLPNRDGKQTKEFTSYYRKWKRANNPEYCEQGRQAVRAYRKANPEKRLAYKRKYAAKHKEEIRADIRAKRCTPEWRAQRNAKLAIQRQDPLFRLRHALGSRIGCALKLRGISRKAKKTMELIGCSLEYFREHIEKQFLSGMTWENRGFWGWHVDHIKALAKAKTEEELYALCHYTNLRPLWATDNWSKRAKTVEEYEAYLQAA